jgi:SAM-dependent methyltransferase
MSTLMTTNGIYSNTFFDSVTDSALQSAKVIVPMVLDLVNASSVLDVGCGRGAWLTVFKDHGVERIIGIDGSYVDQSKLLIESRSFFPTDLSRPFKVPGVFDLAICLEVAEHLPASIATKLVHQLTEAAPVILFSAAIPGQGGTNHINEQWPWYWEKLFEERGYYKLDPIRTSIWQDQRVASWYRQNLFLYASSGLISESPRLKEERLKAKASDLELINKNQLLRYTYVSGIMSLLPGMIWKSLKRRIFGS